MLSRNKRCPVHRVWNCQCARASAKSRPLASKWETVRPGVRRIRDEHSPTGYRWKLSDSERRKVMDRRIREQSNICPHCEQPFLLYEDVAPDHIEPKGNGGGRFDDGENGANIRAIHTWCNFEKGSRRIA